MSPPSSSQGGSLSESDIQRISDALSAKWLPGGSKSHLSDLLLGFFSACILLGLIWYCFRGHIFRRLARKEQAFAVEALKDMDKDTLKEVLGDVNLPSWITFPDFERVGWVNEVLDQLWPYVNEAVCTTARERLDPMLAENKPGWISSIKLFRFDLGEKPPQANGVKVYKSPAAKDQVIIEADFIWAGEQDVQLNVKPIPRHLGPLEPVGQVFGNLISLRVGTEKLIVTGRIRIALRPLIEELPVVAAIQVAFVEMPSFSLNLTLYGGDVSFLPGLEAYLSSFVKDSILRPYVLPESFVWPLVDVASLGIEKPQGMLFIKLLEATNVPRMDMFTDSDCFVKLFTRDKNVLKSQVKQNSKHPRWNEEFKLLVHEPDYQSLNAILLDFDALNPDDEIGRVSVPIRDLPNQEKQDLWLDIFDYAEDAKAREHIPDDKMVNGLFGTVRNVKNLTASAISRFERRVPGVDRNKKCKLHLEVTYYKFEAQEIESAVDHSRENPPGEAALDEASAPEASRHEEHRSDAIGDAHANGESHVEADRSRPGDKLKSKHQSDEAVNVLRGGVLYVRPKQGHHVLHKRWYKGGLLGTTTTCKVRVADMTKQTVTARGPDPLFTEPLEFLLGGDEVDRARESKVTVELWDYRLKNQFQGSISISLQEIMDKKRIKERYQLEGVRHGDLTLEMQWMSAMSRQ